MTYEKNTTLCERTINMTFIKTADLRKTLKDAYGKYKGDFLFGLAVCFIAHFVLLANYLFNHDSVATFFSNSSWLITQGKWFSSPISLLKGSLGVHYSQALIGLVFTALSAVLLCNAMECENPLARKIIIAMYALFPTVGVCMMYNGLDYFAFTAFLSIAAALIGKKRGVWNFIFAVILLTFSIGAYQGYIGFAAAVFVFYCLKKLLDENSKIRDVFADGIYYIAILLVSVICYYVILQVVLKLFSIQLSDYKGISNMSGILNPKVLFPAIVTAYKNTIGFFTQNLIGPSSAVTLYLKRAAFVLMVASVIHALAVIIKRKTFGKAALFAALSIFVLPVAANFIGVLSNNTSFYYVTAYPIVFLMLAAVSYLFSIKITKKHAADLFARGCVALISTAIIFNMFTTANVQYEKSERTKAEMDSKITELITIIHTADGYTPSTPIVFSGKTPYNFLKSGYVTGSYAYMLGYSRAEDMIYSDDILGSYITNVLNYDIVMQRYAEVGVTYESILKEMPVYPAQGSLKMVNGVLLVKLGEVE